MEQRLVKEPWLVKEINSFLWQQNQFCLNEISVGGKIQVHMVCESWYLPNPHWWAAAAIPNHCMR